MSHHFDSAADRADGRINPCDLYAFPGAPGTTALILTVNPDAGRSSPATFRADALYEFVVTRDGGTTEENRSPHHLHGARRHRAATGSGPAYGRPGPSAR